jgi:hypothetical protein
VGGQNMHGLFGDLVVEAAAEFTPGLLIPARSVTTRLVQSLAVRIWAASRF